MELTGSAVVVDVVLVVEDDSVVEFATEVAVSTVSLAFAAVVFVGGTSVEDFKTNGGYTSCEDSVENRLSATLLSESPSWMTWMTGGCV